ncbi:hypothetical protein ACU8V7_23145 [Zobellia nedashkovskayae]
MKYLLFPHAKNAEEVFVLNALINIPYRFAINVRQPKKKVEKIRKKISRSSIIFELILTFFVGFVAKFLFKGKAEEMTNQSDGAVLHELTLWIPFFMAAGFVSILYMYSEYIRNKPKTNKVTVTVYTDSSSGCIGSVMKYFILFFHRRQRWALRISY